MRLLIVGSDQVYAIENFYVKYLKDSGVHVSLFTAQNYFYAYYNKSIINKLLYKISFSGIIGKINILFRKKIREFNPDIIWIFKGMEITPSSLKWAKRHKIKLFNYNPDNPFIFSGNGSGNINVTKSIPLFDIHFTYNLSVKERLEKEFNLKTAWLPFGFDLNEEIFNKSLDQEEIIRVCFVGNPDEERVDFIERMAEEGIKIDVFGHNWDRFIKHPSIKISKPIYGEDFWKTLRRYRIQLNLMRVHNLDSHNMRSFELPAVGGIMLAPDTKEHKLFFKNREEVFLFDSFEESITLTKKILGMKKEDVDIIRERARSRSLQEGYSYKDRAKAALKVLQSVFT